EIRERELSFFDDNNWIEFSVENLPNHSFTLFNNSNQRMIYQGQLDSRGHAYVNLEPDIKLVDVVFDRQAQHRAWYQDVPLQILGGLRDAGQSTLDLLWDSNLINPILPLFFARVHAEIISDKPIGQAPNPIQIPEVSPPQTISGGITHGVSQFIVGFIPAVRATKFIKPLKNVGSWVKGMIAGSVTDFTVFSPHEERLSNLVQEFPELANPITEYLQAKPDDSFAEGRLKNSLEGLLVGCLAEPLTRSLRLLKYSRIKITGTEVRAKVHHKIEAVEVELDEVNWNNSNTGINAISNIQQTIKEVDPKYLISRQNSNEISGSDIKRLVKDMKTNGFDISQPIDIATINGKMIIIDGHHRAVAAIKAGIKKVPVRVNHLTEAQADQLLIEAAEAHLRY
ncbi:ParB/RepB/Spo0J family partition protein, partial [Gilliamella sp. CG25]|uniref:ParB/RepB/Spo0J family partition protein n=1 Tax=Gilliamella sp. CG25 TaxID=3351505 RepID=UPI00398760EB